MVVDPAFLRRATAVQGDPVPAIINTDGGHLVVSSAVQAHLTQFGARGYSLVDVLDVQTRRPSSEYAVLRATTSWAGPCLVHAPCDPEGCPGCGHGRQYLGERHVSREAVGPLDPFRRIATASPDFTCRARSLLHCSMPDSDR